MPGIIISSITVMIKVCTPDIELQVCKMTLPETRATYVINVYRPPDGDVGNALIILQELLGDLSGAKSPDIVMMGDFNIDISQSSPANRKVSLFASNCSLDQLIKKPTRITNTSQTVIDHAYVKNSIFYETRGVSDPGLSDHCLIYICRKRLKIKRKVNYIFARSYRS